MQDRHPSIGEFRSIGLFGVIELVKNRGTREPIVDWTAGETGLMEQLYKELKEGLGAIDEVLNLADRAVK